MHCGVNTTTYAADSDKPLLLKDFLPIIDQGLLISRDFASRSPQLATTCKTQQQLKRILTITPHRNWETSSGFLLGDVFINLLSKAKLLPLYI